MIKILKCENGHVLPISLDNNECGCHHDGKPCLVFSCKECFEESFKDKDKNKSYSGFIYIPLDKEGVEIIKKLEESADSS